jgi:hypothetical protein
VATNGGNRVLRGIDKLIHPSAWNRNSRKFRSSILYSSHLSGRAGRSFPWPDAYKSTLHVVLLDRYAPRRIRLARKAGYDEVVTEHPSMGTVLLIPRRQPGEGRCVRAVPFVVLVVAAVLLGLVVVGVLYLLVRRWL